MCPQCKKLTVTRAEGAKEPSRCQGCRKSDLAMFGEIYIRLIDDAMAVHDLSRVECLAECHVSLRPLCADIADAVEDALERKATCLPPTSAQPSQTSGHSTTGIHHGIW